MIFSIRKSIRGLVAVLVMMTSFLPLAGQQTELRTLTELSSRNPVFRQFMDDVEKAYMAEARRQTVIPSIYEYAGKTGDTLFTVSARCNIPVETIALLNGFSSPDQDLSGRHVLLSTAAGLFYSETPSSFLENLVATRLSLNSAEAVTVPGQPLLFVQSERLTPTERAFFLDSRMRSPLPEGVLSSAFGMRVSPITGNDLFHYGIDLAAPENTTISACKAGIVIEAGTDSTYGNYVVLKHDDHTQSFYAHMSRIEVKTGDSISSGETVGYVGSTGLVTGPHLHFEIREDGKAVNPEFFINK